ncbi:MAG: DUF4248 domain-containing protein [Oscillospiraceae bacterium]|nr:DUF4248 domain-containing protein [Oscillospiraceae bacterium]
MAKRKKQKVYGITLDAAQRHLEQWMEAELEITTHQSYTIGDRVLTMADLSQVRLVIDYWNEKVKALEAAATNGRNRVYRVVPRDY